MNQNDRPKFFEGQYLGAADLAAGVDYTRLHSARHELGAHTWGIAAGLELVEQPLASGAVQVKISPGFAWDGYGRPIVVLAPVRLTADLFRNYTADTIAEGDIVKIWLHYNEGKAQNPQPGFEVCQDNQYSRIKETFTIAVGELNTTHNVIVNGRSLDAKFVRQAFNDNAPQLFDESVPYQEIPDSGSLPRWPILLGYVRWFRQGSAPGYLKARIDSGTPRDSDEIRRLRRYIGVVAEEVLAADGALRLRDRNKEKSKNYVAPAATTDPANSPDNDLLWVEGHTRIEGDTRLMGGQLEWRNSAGDFDSVPMLVRRNENNGFGGKSLEVGFAATTPPNQGKNSLVVGPTVLDSDGSLGSIESKVVVQDNGDVGIGTATPRSRLEVVGRSEQPATVSFVPHSDKGQNESHVHWDGSGDWYIRSASEDGKVILQDMGGNVGIGTDSPDRVLTIQGSEGTYVNIKSYKGTQEVLIGADNGGAIVSAMTNHNLQLRAGRNDTKMVIQTDGNVGIGTTSPSSKLEVHGSVKLGSSGDYFALGALADWRMVAGQVPNAGSVTGSGFNASNLDAGHYRVTFSPAFNSTPIIVATLVSTTNENNILTVCTPAPGGFELWSKDVTGEEVSPPPNSAFNFIAVGPRS